jgi:division protein CdvB (Snf7/Vps24/ESCRT-III family)
MVAASLQGVWSVLEELRSQDLAAIPEIGMHLGEIEESLRRLGLEARISDRGSAYIPVTDDEARRILEEARVVAEERMKDKLPQP